MAGDPRRDDDDMWRGLEHEFGPRRPRDEDVNEPLPPPEATETNPLRPARPATGDITPPLSPPPPRPQQVRVQLTLHRSWSVYVLLALNVAIWAVPALIDAIGLGQGLAASLAPRLDAWLPSDLRPATALLAEVPNLTLTQLLQLLGRKDNFAIFVDGQGYRLMTAAFLHGGLLHILFNAFAIYALGPECERLYGTARFLAIYFIAALGGSLASYALNVAPSVGASGAVFGVAGGLGAFYYLLRDLLGSFSRTQLSNIGGILFINLLIGFTAGGTIDNYGHIGGLLGGALAGLILTPRIAIDARLYPPRVVRRDSPLVAWGLALALTLALVGLAVVATPPLR